MGLIHISPCSPLSHQACYMYDTDLYNPTQDKFDNVTTIAACQRLCQKDDACNFFVYVLANCVDESLRRRCHFKATGGPTRQWHTAVAGPKYC